MRRRISIERLEPLLNSPVELSRFVFEEWPGGPLQARGAFYDARHAWAADHGVAPDVDEHHVLPDCPFDPDAI